MAPEPGMRQTRWKVTLRILPEEQKTLVAQCHELKQEEVWDEKELWMVPLPLL